MTRETQKLIKVRTWKTFLPQKDRSIESKNTIKTRESRDKPPKQKEHKTYYRHEKNSFSVAEEEKKTQHTN